MWSLYADLEESFGTFKVKLVDNFYWFNSIFLLLLFNIIASDFSRIKEINWLCIEYITCTLLLTLSNSKLSQLFCRHASQFMIKSSTCELPLHRLSWTMVCFWKKTITLRRPSRYKLMGFYATFCIFYISIIIHVLVMLYFSPLFFSILKLNYYTWFSIQHMTHCVSIIFLGFLLFESYKIFCITINSLNIVGIWEGNSIVQVAKCIWHMEYLPYKVYGTICKYCS